MNKLPYRLRVLQALTAHLEMLRPGVHPAYTYDLTGKVYRGRHVLGDEATNSENLPILSILESPRPDVTTYTDEWKAYRKDAWVLLIQGIGKDDPLNPTDPLYILAAEVEMHLARLIATGSSRSGNGNARYPDEHLLGGLIADMEIAPSIIRPAEKGISTKAFFYLPLRLTLVADLADPFA